MKQNFYAYDLFKKMLSVIKIIIIFNSIVLQFLLFGRHISRFFNSSIHPFHVLAGGLGHSRSSKDKGISGILQQFILRR